jgi:bacteriorhodopsin
MNDLSALSAADLEAIKARLTNWLVGIVAIDLLVVTGFVLILVTKSPRHALPLAPLLALPALALFPVLRRLGAVKKEMARRSAGGSAR